MRLPVARQCYSEMGIHAVWGWHRPVSLFAHADPSPSAYLRLTPAFTPCCHLLLGCVAFSITCSSQMGDQRLLRGREWRV